MGSHNKYDLLPALPTGTKKKMGKEVLSRVVYSILEASSGDCEHKKKENSWRLPGREKAAFVTPPAWQVLFHYLSSGFSGPQGAPGHTPIAEAMQVPPGPLGLPGIDGIPGLIGDPGSQGSVGLQGKNGTREQVLTGKLKGLGWETEATGLTQVWESAFIKHFPSYFPKLPNSLPGKEKARKPVGQWLYLSSENMWISP